MWVVFALAALLMLVAGVGGSLVAKLKLAQIPPDIFKHLPLIENVGLTAGVTLSLLGVALALRRLKRYERGGLKRMRRTGRLTTPKREPEPEEFEVEPEVIEAGGEEPVGFDTEPATKRMRKV